MIPNGPRLLSFQMKILNIFDSKNDSVGPFISSVEAFKVWTSKGFSKEILSTVAAKNVKNIL